MSTKFGILEYIEAVPAGGVAESVRHVLLFHGDGRLSDCHHWASAMVPLAERGFHVRSFSMPGYGKSTGRRSDFRENGAQVILEIIAALHLKSCVIAGRSVGGKSVLYAAATGDKRITHVVATHPVIPTADVLHSIRVPVMLTWAEDDPGHPFAGPHGFNYVRRELGKACKKAIAWREDQTPGGWEAFYATRYADELSQFVHGAIHDG